eukprot:augustus_masked-scaffold_18-processed-gene-3.16-mRNA-1 protein AED:0.40 eAED:0.40 QI:0/-1/0/1/-1/1/1/0/304
MKAFNVIKDDSQSFNCIELVTPENASVSIYLFGAMISSWKTSAGIEQLFMSKLSSKKEKKQIHGGIPIVFPNFSEGLEGLDLPFHGFARLCTWEFEGYEINNDAKRLTFKLSLDHNTVKDQLPHAYLNWPFKFLLSLSGSLSFCGDSLDLELTVKNLDNKTVTFQSLFHPYFSVEAIENIVVKGLKDVKYVDKTDEFKEKVLEGELKVEGEVDWIFSPGVNGKEVFLYDGKRARRIVVSVINDGSAQPGNVVVWNPWKSAKSVDDFDDEEYKEMICVEPGFVSSLAVLPSGKEWKLIQNISIQT